MKPKSGKFGKGGAKGKYNSSKGRKPKDRDENAHGTDTDMGRKLYDHAPNPFEWYARYPQLLEAAARIPFPYRPGMSLELGVTTQHPTSTQFAIPGVMALEWVPTFGNSKFQTDPASIAVKEMYAKVRSKFSGSLEADPPDFLIYLGALDSIFSYTAFLKRVYRCVTAYSEQNYLVPNYLLYAMGFSDESVQALRMNKVQLWQLTNELILMTRKFKCPAIMDFMNRHHWLNEHVFTDANMMNSQMYMFSQQAFWKFGMLDTPDGVPAGGLYLQPFWANITQGDSIVTQLYDYGLQLINALAGWDDGYTISGYLLRAYEGSPDFYVDTLVQDEVITPKYDELVLLQIQNSRSLPAATDILNTIVASISQDPKTNVIISQPLMETTGMSDALVAAGLKNIIGVRAETPTSIDVTEATRLQSFLTSAPGSDDKTFAAIDAATEILLQYRILKQEADGAVFNRTFSSVMNIGSAGASLTVLGTVANITAWDWHPYLVLTTGNTYNVVSLFGDTMNMTVIGPDDLANLHRVCLYSVLSAFTE